jgi:hypothetical protein
MRSAVNNEICVGPLRYRFLGDEVRQRSLRVSCAIRAPTDEVAAFVSRPKSLALIFESHLSFFKSFFVLSSRDNE